MIFHRVLINSPAVNFESSVVWTCSMLRRYTRAPVCSSSVMPVINPSTRAVRFGPFRVDLHAGELFKGDAKVRLQEQPFTVLRMLLEGRGDVVTRQKLREQLWPADTFVDYEHGINVAVAKIREALGDCTEAPRFVGTVGRRGYRFLAPIELIPADEVPLPPRPLSRDGGPSTKPHSVGRQEERADLMAAFDSLAGRSGLMVCVAGEPGIAKTTLVQDFLSDLHSSGKGFSLAVGRCSQRLAGSDAYLPFLEALDSLLRRDGGESRDKLTALAPSWYAQLFPPSEKDPWDARLREYVMTTTEERVKRELIAFLHEVTRDKPLVLFFDDAHWADPSTVDLLAHLATKFDLIRILLVVTYRPSELLISKHPFIEVQRDLRTRSQARTIDVQFLSATDVERYVALQFPENTFPPDFALMVHSKTEGNPLFVVDLLRYLRDRKVIVKAPENEKWGLAEPLPGLSRDFPQSVSSVINRKIDQLNNRERDILRAAAIQGYEFDSAALARALEADATEIEEALDRIERIHAFAKHLREDEFPDGTPTVRYRFVHALYQNVLEASLTPARRVVLSGALARTLVALYGQKNSTIASQLGFLYEAAREPSRASEYFRMAAINAQRIFANKEALALARRGLALLGKTPETRERTRKELDLQITLGFSLLFTRGYGVVEIQETMTRAQVLCETLGDSAQLFSVLFGFWLYYMTAPQVRTARDTAERLLEIAREVDHPPLLLMAHTTLGIALQHLGELRAAQKEFGQAFTYHEPTQHAQYLELYRMEPGINARSHSVRVLWLLGYPDQARCRSDDGVLLARSIPSPPSLGYALMHAAFLYQHLRLPEKTRQMAEECIKVCDDHGAAQERTWATFALGWAIAELGQAEQGIAQIHASLDAQLSIGGQIARPQFLGFLAEIYLKMGRPEDGLRVVEEGLAVAMKNEDRYYDAELSRLQGEFFNMQGKTQEAEYCFNKGIEIARNQQTRSLELRASTSLARFWKKHGKEKKAQQLLGEVHAWFSEGFDTADLQEAASLLEDLS